MELIENNIYFLRLEDWVCSFCFFASGHSRSE